jgi:hypothetical protein
VNYRLLSIVVLVSGLVAYPAIVLAGGTPHFPRRSECIHAATSANSESLVAVFGRFRDREAARNQRRRVVSLGFKGAELQRDGCGFIRVVVHGIPSVAVGRDLLAEARTVGLHPTLESTP